MPRKSVQLVAGVLVVAALAAACTRTPPGGEVAFAPGAEFGGAPTVGPDGTPIDDAWIGEGDDPLGDDFVMPVPGDGRPPAGGDPGASTGGTGPQGPAAPGAGGGSPAQGVTGGTVKFVYSTKLQDCGDDPTTANQGTANEKGLRVLASWVTWFNEEVLADEGWQLEYEVVDDGGPFCPEKAQAAAQRIAKDIKPFAVLSDLTQPARGPVVADVVTRAGIVHIGESWWLGRNIRERAPYAWPTFALTERQLENLIGWAEKRVKGTQVADGVSGVPVDRVYGILALDTPEGRELAGVVRDHMRARGMDPLAVYLIAGDPGVAAQQANTTALKMRQDGVNTLVFGLPYPAAINSTIVLSEAMNAQNYLPEILTGNYGLALFDSLHNRRVWSRVRGTSTMPALVLRWAVAPDSSGSFQIVPEFEEIPENESGYIKVWQDRLGNNDQPQDDSVPAAYTTWTHLTLLVTGLLHLDGPLTPQSFGEAVHSARRGGPNRCTVGRFLQRDYLYSAGFDWELGNSGMRAKSTSMYWVNRQTPFGTNGYYESYDNYAFYGAEEWPAEHTRDTGEEGVDIPKQERIGIRPWIPCSQFPNYPNP